ncbi:glycosyltransferase [Elusimicrobiota bacterium]
MINITVAIISSNNKYEYLRETVFCIKQFNASVFIVLNGFNQIISEFLKETKKTYPNLDYIVIKDKIEKSLARNICVENIKSDVIYFLDDDAFFTHDNIKILSDKFTKYPLLGVVGGPNLTPENSTRFEKITGIMLATYFLSWKMSRRYLRFGSDRFTDDSELILCNLAIKRDIFIKYNLQFEKKLHYNEENLLLEKIKKHDIKMLYTPDLSVYHHRRSSIDEFSVQVFNSGKGRALMLFFMPSSLHFIYLLPALFVLYLAWGLIFKTKFIFLAVYLLLTVNNIANAFFNNKLKVKDIPLMFLISITAHIFYGIGFINGIVQGIIWKVKK